jgi:hypothetical protein
MKLRTLSNRLLMIAAGVCAVAAPSYAHWGGMSSWVRAGHSTSCVHAHVSTNGDATWVRSARVRVKRKTSPVECTPVGPEIPGDICFGGYQYDEASVTNELSTADIILWGLDDLIPSGILPFGRFFDNVPRDGVRILPSPSGKIFTSLRAACQVSNNMTTTL